MDFVSSTVTATTASEYENVAAVRTIEDHPELFKIVTPVRVDCLRELLKSHPNQAFVKSVLEGLHGGFWLWPSTVKDGYPETLDESKEVYLSPEKEEFLKKQLEHEQSLGRISHEFGKDLLPGMYCMPSYVVPKPHSADWQLVDDLSAGPYLLNSMVDHHFVTEYPLDNLAQLGEMIMKKHHQYLEKQFVAWKSDISEAYRTCLMHKLWQLKQIVRINGCLCVNRVNVFGGPASPAIFISLNALLAWAAKNRWSIKGLVYVDDSFGLEEEGL